MEAVYQLDPKRLQALNVRAVMVDLDNTLIAWDNPDGTPESFGLAFGYARKWFKSGGCIK